MALVEKKIYPFINDLVFKATFGQQKNAKLLICLLNAILHRKGPEQIETVEILNPFNVQDFDRDKLTIVDVKAKVKNGEWFTIEVQVEPEKSYVARSVYYLAKLYSAQLIEAEDFTKLTRATGISIVNFRLFPESLKIQNIFRLKNVESAAELFDAFELHYIELLKVPKDPKIKPKTPFERWLHILKFSKKYLEDGTLPAWAKDEEGIPMAMQELGRINSDEKYRRLLEDREKSELVRRTRLAQARLDGLEEGHKEGLKEGLQKGQASLIATMLQNGATVESIIALTGLSSEELNELLKQIPALPTGQPKKVSEAHAPFGQGKPSKTKRKHNPAR